METAYVSSYANYLAPQPLQFEVKNWLSGHGRIVQSGVSDGSRVRKDGKNRVQRPRRGRVEDRCGWQAKRMAQRHTVHFDTPPRKDGLERTGSIRGHRSTRSCPHQQTRQVCSGKAEGMLGLGAPGGLPEENMEGQGPGTMTAEHNGRSWHRRTLSSQRGAYSWMVERERASYASSVDSGDTSLGTSTQFSSPPLSPLSSSPWSPTFLHLSASSFLKPPVIPSPNAPSSPATAYSDSVYSDSQTGASSNDSTGTSSPSSSARANSPSSTFKGRPPNLHLHHYSLPSSASPQFSESPPSPPSPLPSTMMEDNSRLQRAFSVLKPSKIRSKIVLCPVLHPVLLPVLLPVLHPAKRLQQLPLPSACRCDAAKSTLSAMLLRETLPSTRAALLTGRQATPRTRRALIPPLSFSLTFFRPWTCHSHNWAWEMTVHPTAMTTSTSPTATLTMLKMLLSVHHFWMMTVVMRKTPARPFLGRWIITSSFKLAPHLVAKPKLALTKHHHSLRSHPLPTMVLPWVWVLAVTSLLRLPSAR